MGFENFLIDKMFKRIEIKVDDYEGKFWWFGEKLLESLIIKDGF